ncbi:NAD-specific glutamate dehydrogenase [compost metagenome]
MNQRITLVTGSGQLFELAVFLSVGLGVTHHALDLFVRQAGVGLDHDRLRLAGGLVLGADVQDAVGVDVEGYFDLRHATWSWRNVSQVELAQRLVLGSLLALTLQYVNGHGTLVVIGSREHLRLLGRDGGVLLDQRSHHATHGFDTQGQRADVQQQYVFHVTGQHGALDGSTHGHGFVRVDVLARFFTEEVGNGFLYQRHTGLATDQDHVVDLAGVDAGVFQGDAARLDGTLDQVFDQRLQLGAGDLHVQVLRTGGICSDVRQVDVGRLSGRQLDLGFLGSFLQALHGQRVAFQVHAGFFLELFDQVVDQQHVEVFATQEGVAVGGQYFELVLTVDFGDFDDRNVEGTATQVINDDSVVALGLVHAVGQRSGGRFVDDTFYVQTSDATGILGSLALAVVEVGRYGDDRFGDRLAEVVFGGFLHLFQNFGADLRRRHFLTVHFDPGVTVVGLGDLVRNQLNVFLHNLFFEAAADQALYREQGVVRVGDGLALGRLANQDFAIVGVGHDRRGSTRTFGVFDDFDVTVFQNGDARVGGPQVDTDDFTHVNSPET